MPRGKYDRKLAREMRDAKKTEGKIPISVSPTATEIKVGEGLEPAPAPALTPNADELSKKYKLPRGICRCGHTGDGPLSDHADIGRGEGMGPCSACDCDCIEFFFERYTDFFAHKGLKTEASKKALEETTRKLLAGAVSKGQEKWAEVGPIPNQAESGAVNRTQSEPAAMGKSIPSPEHAAPPAIKDDAPCAKCGGEVGHKVNCPDGIAFSNALPAIKTRGEHTKEDCPAVVHKGEYDRDTCYTHHDEKPVLTLNPLPMMPKIGSPNVSMGAPIDSLKEAARILREKGYKIVEPPAPKRPVYDLSFNPDHPERATITVTLTTKERVIMDLFPPTNIGEAKAVPAPYLFFGYLENGLSLKDAVRIARGIMKIVRHGEKHGRDRREPESV